jgi:hypothetical protein
MTQSDTGTGVLDHGGGVWSIKVPIPDNPLGHTLVHLLDTDRGPVLVDTGWDDPASWDTLVASLASLDVRVEDIHGVLITHHHPPVRGSPCTPPTRRWSAAPAAPNRAPGSPT